MFENCQKEQGKQRIYLQMVNRARRSDAPRSEVRTDYRRSWRLFLLGQAAQKAPDEIGQRKCFEVFIAHEQTQV